MDPSLKGFARRMLIANAITLLFIAVTLFAWANLSALLVVFAGILLSILISELAQRVVQWLHLSYQLAVASVIALLLSAIAVGIWLGAAPIGRQLAQLLDSLPQALTTLREWLAEQPALSRLLPAIPSGEQIMSRLPRLLPDAAPLFSGALGALINMVVIIVIGIYLAAQPRPYLRSLLLMVPPAQRPRAAHVLDTLGNTLARWLLGKALSMLIVGIMVAVSLGLLGVPLALVLGVIAGLLDFIPYLGPLLAGVPAVLIAFAHSPAVAVYTALVFLAIQLVEGYLLIPLIERRAVALPPALTIAMQLLLGSLAGLAGVALATPLTAVIVVLVTMLYLQDVLDAPVKPPGEA